METKKIQKIGEEEILALKESVFKGHDVEVVKEALRFIKKFCNRVDEEFQTKIEQEIETPYPELYKKVNPQE